MDKRAVRILYTNYRGETGYRMIVPISISFQSTDWHPQEQWILTAFDLDKNAERGFAVADIQKWEVMAPDG